MEILFMCMDSIVGKTHIGYVPYKTGGMCMVCTCTAGYAFHRPIEWL